MNRVSSCVSPALILEEDESVRTMLSVTLEEMWGIGSFAVSSLEGAMSLLAGNDVSFAIVDAVIRGTSGILIRQELMRLKPGLGGKMIFICGGMDSLSFDVEEMARSKGLPFLRKPFRQKDLEEGINKVLSTG